MQEPYAIVVIDVWDTNNLVNKNLISMYEQMTQRICKLIQSLPNKHQNRVLVSKYNLETYHIHRNLESVIYDYGKKKYYDYCLYTDDQDEAIKWLNDNKIKKLYYTGSSMPGCVTDRPLGLKNMPDSFDKAVVLDAVSLTTAFEHHSDWAVLHHMYQVSTELSKEYGWELTWTNQILK
mgnify:CR=1 FL=1